MYDERYDEIDERIHPCRSCEDYDLLNDSCKSNGGCAKPLTNANLTYAQTIKLAEMFGVEIDCDGCKRMTKGCGKPCTTYANCIKHWENWLKQEVDDVQDS